MTEMSELRVVRDDPARPNSGGVVTVRFADEIQLDTILAALGVKSLRTQVSKPVELLPCPFCQGPAVNVGGDYITCGAGWNPACAGHMVRTDVETWNTRAALNPSSIQPVEGEIERLRNKMRMIVSHATGGHSQDIDASTNDICVLISQNRNHVYAHGQEVGARDARAAIAALKPDPIVERLLDQLAERSNWQLTCGPVDGDLSTCAWQVHRVNGGRNDREWTLIATGETAREALTNARAALTESTR